ncbi:MAG: membrane integrity-associated transporter subunit PqiC [Opitutales bacterium]
MSAPIGVLFSVLCLLLLAGCNLPIEAAQPDPVRHFTLGSTGTPAAFGGVHVLPVQTAGHLHPRELAVRVGESEIIYLNDARWAEPLAEGLTSLLQARLSDSTAEGTLRVEISRCEPLRSAGNTVDFRASYSFQPAGGGPAVTGVFAATPRPWDGRDPAGLVALYRAAAEDFGSALAAALARK